MTALAEGQSAALAAGKAGLRYVSDSNPGIRRKNAGSGFRYVAVDGKPVHDRQILVRIRSLVIPPAWTDVWICPSDRGHMQVTARDARGRKQYRYHPRWRSTRDANKYAHVIGFGKALPAIRRRVDKDLSRQGLPRDKVLATVVRLLEKTMMRVGNEEYARSNGSFGLTTLRDRHVRIDGARLQFRFKGKSSKEHFIELNDGRLAAIVRRCRDLPGYELFQYLDADGERCSIDSEDVHGYLREITGEDFRTWTGTLLAALALREFETFDSQAQAKKHLVRAIESVAAKLGNTPAICRSPGRTDETRCRTNRSAPVCRRSWHLFFRDFFPGLGRSRSVLAPIHDSDCHAGRVQSADQDQGKIVGQWAATQPGCHRIAQRCMPAHHGRLAGDGKGIRSLPIGRDARQFAHRDRQDLHRQPDAGQNCGTRHDSGPVGCDHRQREDDQITKCKVEQDHDQQSEAEQKVDASEHVDR